jgi:choline dehydrogenase-like flavoprotein
VDPFSKIPDVLVVGSGAGGAPLIKSLSEKGLRVLVLERGRRIPREADNSSVSAVFKDRKYSPNETWLDLQGRGFRPSAWYNVGGSTKMFGTVMMRLRERDFGPVEHAEGLSPAWPISYTDLEPYYGRAEALFGVHGDPTADPWEPPRSAELPHGAVGSEPFVANVFAKLQQRGLHPFPLPVAVDLHEGGKCIRCGTCDGFPCPVGGKNDAETRAIEPALRTGLVEFWEDARVQRLITTPDGRHIQAVEVVHRGETKLVSAKIVILSSGAVNSAAILLRSEKRNGSGGLANSSGQVGRNYMTHNLTTMMAVSRKLNPTRFQKTLAFNDFYDGESGFPYPMGNVQTLGKLQAGMLVAGAKYLPASLGAALTRRSLDMLATSEDLPRPENRITLESDTIRISVSPTNMRAHRRLNRRLRRILHEVGFPIVLAKTLPVNFTAAQCGTVRMGSSPSEAPLDQFCRAFDHQNLFVVDASFFPSSAAVNPALTIAAQSLRVADHIAAVDFGLAPNP